jgi:hypothetical protein
VVVRLERAEIAAGEIPFGEQFSTRHRTHEKRCGLGLMENFHGFLGNAHSPGKPSWPPETNVFQENIEGRILIFAGLS